MTRLEKAVKDRLTSPFVAVADLTHLMSVVKKAPPEMDRLDVLELYEEFSKSHYGNTWESVTAAIAQEFSQWLDEEVP